jgi:bifunctional enzyme CysN/CysC
VAYRYFATPKRKFIIADTPGHIQYTRNMVTGASTADLAMVLVDARKGCVEQSRRHAFLASLLRVPHLVLCVNKMDLVDWDQDRFDRDQGRVPRLRHQARHPRPHHHPGVGAARRQRRHPLERMPWYEGPRCCTTSKRCTSPATATWSTSASRCST